MYVSELFCCLLFFVNKMHDNCNLPRKPPADYFQFEFFFLSE